MKNNEEIDEVDAEDKIFFKKKVMIFVNFLDNDDNLYLFELYLS
jgi:hypothetical protein